MKTRIRTLPFLISLLFFLQQVSAQKINLKTEIKGDTTILLFAEQMPEFPGGNDELSKFLANNIKYPKIAQNNGIEGRCILTFVVCDDGKICKIESVGKKLGWGMEEEAIRVIEAMPAWNPGRQNGKPVFVKFTLPIRYQLLDHVIIDTLYYNKAWKKSSKDSASFIRIIKPTMNQFAVSDYYYPSMKIQMTGTYSTINDDKEIENGTFQYFSDSGYKTSEGVFIEGKKEGLWKYFFDNGSVWYTKTFRKDKQDGDCFTYYPNGSKRRMEKFDNGNLKKGICYTREGKDTTYFPMEEMPEYPGGEEALTKFLSRTIQYPPDARENGVEGRVLIQFIVDVNGKLEEVEIMSSPHYTLSTETLRVIFLMPRWKPGRQEGVPVQVKFTLPVRFQLK